MKKYQFKVDEPAPGKDISDQYKNFEGLWQSYATVKPPIIKPLLTKAVWLAAASVVVVLSVWFWPGPAVDQPAANLVDPPFEQVNIPFTAFNLDAGDGGKLKYSSGSAIHIPPQAFLDKNGKPVTGEVKILYRELHDPVDFFVSGIPMTMDSAGTSYHMESAGMVEIKAVQHGKPVFVNPEQLILVEMASDFKGQHYNLYFLDHHRQQWISTGNDVAAALDTTDPIDSRLLRDLLATVRSIQVPPEPQRPVKAGKNKYRFDIDVIDEEFPEIALYEGVTFEIEEGQAFDPGLYDILWEDISLKKESGQYIVSLTKEEIHHEFKVYPVLEEREYDKAYAAFEEKYVAYTQALNQKKAAEQKVDEMQRAMESKPEGSGSRMAIATRSDHKTKRSFNIPRFGLWNCDNPGSSPTGTAIAATFQDKHANKLEPEVVFLAAQNRNTLYRFSKENLNALYFDPGIKNILWTITPEEKLAVFYPEDFEQLKANQSSYTFTMNIIDKKVDDLQNIRAVLNFDERASTSL